MRDVCGFILAAGFGTRLRPLTDLRPKPMIRFFGAPLLDLALFRLRSAGIQDIAVNAHYMASSIEDGVRASPWGQGVQVSIEKPVILGRGGAYIPLRGWFGNKTIIAINGDVISDMDVRAALDAHRKAGAIATMMVLPRPLGRDNAVYCNVDGRIGTIAKAPPGSGGPWTARGFACLQVLEPEFLDYLPQEGESDILGAYARAISEGKIVTSFIHDGFWHDLGSPQQLFAAHSELLANGPAVSASLERLGVTGYHAIRGTRLVLVNDGETSVPGTGAPKIHGPSVAIMGSSWGAMGEVAERIEFGPRVVVESGFTCNGPLKLHDSIIYSPATIDTRTAKSHSVLDGFHSVEIDPA